MKRFLGVIIVLFAGACSAGSPVAPAQLADSAAGYFPGVTWRTASAARLGLDSVRFATLANDIAARRYGGIDGVVVVRYGYVALENYVGWSPNTAHTMQSVTKSITSLLFGTTQLQLDGSVLNALPQYTNVANLDDRKRALTFRHMLSMRTSMDFWEQPYSGSPLEQLNNSSGDWVKLVLDRPMTGTPGSTWAYNSGSPIVVCGAIRHAVGEEVDSYARRVLFEPIGVSGEWWYKSPYDGLPHCGGGLNLRAMDLARIGYLVLRKGKWGDKQIVPTAWLDAATKPYSNDVLFTTYGSDYGYYWWLFPTRPNGSDDEIIAASGSGGQWLFVIPKYDLVIAVVASSGDGLSLLYNGVLPAIK